MARRFRFTILPAALTAALAASPPALASPATKLVRYHGYAITIPAAWPVYNLARNPRVCVRFDRHAVYLGTPSPVERCPAHAVGRTEAILISPVVARAADARGLGSATPLGLESATPLAPVSVAAARGGFGSEAQFAVPSDGVTVTATWGRNPALIQRAVHLGRNGLARAAAGLPRPVRAATSRALAPSSGSQSEPTGTIFNGLGFDACSAPDPSQLLAWAASPYRALGIYIGGTNMACAQPNLTAAWVSAETAAGWHLIPTYVGLQAPSSGCGCSTINPQQAAAEGTAAAIDAVEQAQALGLGPGNPIYDDMEAYTPSKKTTDAVLTFLSAWAAQLHADGYVSGVYSSADSGITDLVNAAPTGYLEPDEIWIADWNEQETTADPYVPAGDWANDQRLHQYVGGHNETYDGTTINIDGDYLDGQTTTAWTPPPDGSFVQLAGQAPVYRLVGGAPLYVSDWNAVGGAQPYAELSDAQWALLSPEPADGTFLQTSTGGIYEVAGGAPLWVSSWSVFGGPQPTITIDPWDIDNITSPLAHLLPVPVNGTWLTTPSGQIYRVAGGTPFPIASWTPYGGVRPSVEIDPWDIQHIRRAASHLLARPLNGTVVEGIPSHTYWLFEGGKREQIGRRAGAVAVDDASLKPFAILPSPKCVVPKLWHLTLARARRALGRAHCRLGRVRMPAVVDIDALEVVNQSPRPRATRRRGYPVKVTLG